MAETHDPGAKRGFGARLARSASQIQGDFPLVLLDLVLAVVHLPPPLRAALRLLRPVDLLGRVPDLPARSRAWSASVRCGRGAATAARGVTPASTKPSGCSSAGACTGAVLLLAFMWGNERIPLTVLVAGPIISTFLFGMVRFQQRLFAFRRSSYAGTGMRVAVVGAGTNGAAALREMQQSPMLGLVPVVAVDDNPALRNRSIHGVPHRRARRRAPRDRRGARRPPDPARDAVGAAASRPAGGRHRRSRDASRCACCASRRRGCTACPACGR